LTTEKSFLFNYSDFSPDKSHRRQLSDIYPIIAPSFRGCVIIKNSMVVAVRRGELACDI